METMQQTLDLAVELNCEYANFYCTMAYPGSRLFQATEEEHLPDTWDGVSQHSYETQPLPTKYLSPKEVLQFRDGAFNEYFSNKRYLDMVEQKFGKKVKNHILGMLQIKLERRLLN